MPVKYVSSKTASLRLDRGSIQLLWGDQVSVIRQQGSNSRVRARGVEGWVKSSDLGNQSLLEIYVIDVGQGDGVLMKTPNNKWHLIDAGVANRSQMTKKGAANFLRWKFYQDLRRSRVDLENVILSHADYDHYGGLINLFGGHLPAAGSRPARDFNVRVRNFYHNGMGRFSGSNPIGRSRPGTVDDYPMGYRGIRRNGTFITELLDGKGDFRNPPRTFQDPFTDFAELVGSVPSQVRRISIHDRYLNGYGANAECSIRILGPIVEKFGSTYGIRNFSSHSKTRNGHSVVLRVDYGAARILLTGDLNRDSQRLMMSYIPENSFAVDVAKGCHHGSDDIDLEFVKAMAARGTVISSGDNESYAHPRPRVLGASAKYGREGVAPNGSTMPPLLYSTELSRSVTLGYADSFEVDVPDQDNWWTYTVDPADARFDPEGRSDTRLRPLGETPIMHDMVYGLVNIRTDGRKILFATMMESGHSFDCKEIMAGSSPD